MNSIKIDRAIITLERTCIKEFVLDTHRGVPRRDAVHEAVLLALRTGRTVCLHHNDQQYRLDPAEIFLEIIECKDTKLGPELKKDLAGLGSLIEYFYRRETRRLALTVIEIAKGVGDGNDDR